MIFAFIFGVLSAPISKWLKPKNETGVFFIVLGMMLLGLVVDIIVFT